MGSIDRVFVAVPLPVEIKLALADRISHQPIPGKLVPAENLHLTLRFLGTVSEITYERFLSAMAGSAFPEPFRVRLGAFGTFPNSRRATVVWVGIDQGVSGLQTLHAISDDAALEAAVAPEERPFRPHVTLARVRPPQDVSHLDDDIMGLAWKVDRVVVFRSLIGGDGATYQPLESFSL